MTRSNQPVPSLHSCVASPRDDDAGSTLTVDLDALGDNWRACVERAGRAECAAVVKADAYGLGLDAVAPQLRRHGCRTFFVARAGEGVALRAAVPDATIYVLNGLSPGAVPAYRRARLRPVLGSLPEMEEWTREARRLPCALQLDSGMNRLGLGGADQAAAQRLAARLDLALVLSHLAWTGTHATALAAQVARFAAMRRDWPGVPASLANSAGLFAEVEARHELVRPGYALYGGNPTPGAANPMRPVARLTARVIQLHEVAAGEAVGYDGRYVAAGRRRLATLSIGYADGVPCSASGVDGGVAGMAAVGGRLCPFVGRVSMDLVVIDVTEAPDVRRGDDVELLGETVTLDDAARRAGTIGYELLTRLGGRNARRTLGGLATRPETVPAVAAV